MAFYKLHAAARLPHWLPYISVSSTYDKRTYLTGFGFTGINELASLPMNIGLPNCETAGLFVLQS